jgi:hypothetical protein
MPLTPEDLPASMGTALAVAKAMNSVTAQDFKARSLSPKAALIEGLLHTGDLITLLGRRRHGKTSLALNVGMAGAAGESNYLGYNIARPFSTLAVLLEGLDNEIQDVLSTMAGQRDLGDRFRVLTRRNFFDAKIKIAADDKQFLDYIRAEVKAVRPELLILDNLGLLIGGDYNSGPKMHSVADFIYEMAEFHGTAVMTLAHPRKQRGGDDFQSLRGNAEMFFEECMGSSHFINFTGSLWGIERDEQTNIAYFLGGTQRLNASQSLTALMHSEDRWFTVTADVSEKFKTALNTQARRKTWFALPNPPEQFKYVSARDIAKTNGMSSNSTFSGWWKTLERCKLVMKHEGDVWMKDADAAKVKPSENAMLESLPG